MIINSITKIAQSEVPLDGELKGFGRLGLQRDPATSAPTILNEIISIIIGTMTIIAAIYFLFVITTAALSWMSAGGDKVRIEEARKKMLNGLIGLAIVIAAIFLIDFIGDILDLPNITNPAELIQNITMN